MVITSMMSRGGVGMRFGFMAEIRDVNATAIAIIVINVIIVSTCMSITITITITITDSYITFTRAMVDVRAVM